MTATAPQAPAPRPWTGGRAAAVVAASLAAVMATALVLGGLGLIGVHAFLRDDDGYYASSTERFTTPTYALTGEPADVRGGPPTGWLLDELALRVRIRAAADRGAVFIGIAPQREIDRWLSGVAHERVTDVRSGPFRSFRYGSVRRGGSAPRTLPGVERFWTASVSGTGARTLDWKVSEGRWGVVVMNADGTRGVSADVRVAAKAPLVLLALSMFVLGVLVLGGAAVALRAALREGPR